MNMKYQQSSKNKKTYLTYINEGKIWFFWRRRRDLNPRAGHPTYALSRGAPSANLGTSPCTSLAEREGFEPPVPYGITGFQDQLLKPLGHLSSLPTQYYYELALL